VFSQSGRSWFGLTMIVCVSGSIQRPGGAFPSSAG
jgi:hypothetical protein